MTSKVKEAIKVLWTISGAKTITELNAFTDKVALSIRQESGKTVMTSNYKSKIELDYESQLMLNKSGE